VRQPNEVHEDSYAWGLHAAWLRALAHRDRVVSADSVANAPPGTPSHETAAAVRRSIDQLAAGIHGMMEQPSGMMRLIEQGAQAERCAIAEALAEKARLPHLNDDHRAALYIAIALIEARAKDGAR
jgi:hypothetical protein